MKKLLAIMALLWGGGALAVWYWNDVHAQGVTFRTVPIRRGDLLATINATGTIEPEEVVDVGAQVAGEVQAFGKDPDDPDKPISYGSRVEQGTELAHLDASLYKARVNQAQAKLERAEADVEQAQAKLRQAEREQDRSRRLQAKGPGVISAQEVDKSQSEAEAARAALSVSQSEVAVARADLEEATVNLRFTTIRSPVRGVVLDRRVNLGQTVVASLNAPSLFLIAKDLGRMEIWASVNETDIGAIHAGQPVEFTVGAFPGATFRGKVTQVRLNASMVQNVVTYTVVVEFDNKDGKLLPYLTARVKFEVEGRKDVLLVPNAALRWRPPAQQVAPEVREEYRQTLKRHAPSPGESSRPGSGGGAEGVLWVRRGEFVRPSRVKVGLSDGVLSEVGGESLREGSEVVVGVARQEEGDDASNILPHTKTEKSKR